ncbi:hypothetical protein PENSPDRAFT_749475 [Peniophora sp. CONT]|nr:hypothetical protein PENSPDRAFT_749475 [Peniophora sp. CONT]
MASDNESLQSVPSTMTSRSSTPSLHEPAAAMKKRHSLFYFHSVSFEVEGTLFKVPRYGLPGNAATFEAKFAISSTDDDIPGSSDENPIRLEVGVTEFDFASLLKATYPPPGLIESELSMDEWMSVLKLAKLWDLTDMRDRAVSQTERLLANQSPLEKILLGRKYDVIKWLKDGYQAIAKRPTGLTKEEKESLDLATRCGLLELRDRSWTWASSSYSSSPGSYRSQYPCTDDILIEVFGDELRETPIPPPAVQPQATKRKGLKGKK